jgi:hypothetical protein
MVEGAHPTEYTLSYSAQMKHLPLQPLPLVPCSQPVQPSTLVLFDGEYQHYRVDLPALTPSDILVTLKLWNFSNGAASVFENRNGNLATDTCASGSHECGTNGTCVVAYSCVERLKYLSLKGNASQTEQSVSFSFSSCYEVPPTINVALASPRSQIRAHRQSNYNAAIVSLNLGNISAPHVTLAVDDVRGGFYSRLQTSLCDGAEVLAACDADKYGGCLLELNQCDISLLGNSTEIQLYLVIISESSSGELSILAELKSVVTNLQTIQLGAIQTISLGPSETQPFLFSLPAYSPPINSNFESYRLDIFVYGEDPGPIEAALTLDPNIPAFPSDKNCQIAAPWYQMNCLATLTDHNWSPCMTVQTCSLRLGSSYVLLIRNKLWKFRGTPPIIPIAVTFQVKLVVDAEFSVLHIDAPETTRQLSTDYKNELYASFDGLSATQSLVVEHKAEDLFSAFWSFSHIFLRIC